MASSSNSHRQPRSNQPLGELLESSSYKTANAEIAAINAHLAAPPAKLPSSLDATLIYDDLPTASLEKKALLIKFIQKQLSAGGVQIKSIVVPDDGKNTLGYAFVEYADVKQAQEALGKWNGKLIDKKHKVKVNRFGDYEKFEQLPQDFSPPEIKINECTDFLGWWLLENHRSDQYAIRHAKDTEVYWHEANKKVEPLRSDPEWTNGLAPDHPGFTWSPLGNYFVTFHTPGVLLWGGPQWTMFHRFSHRHVFRIQFSPCENYLVTVSREPDAKHVLQPKEIIIWDIRADQAITRLPLDPEKDRSWPIFKWSHDDKYVARKSDKGISVIETATMTKIKDASGKARDVPIPGLVDYSWSPSSHIIAAYIMADGNRPARVDLLEIPSLRVLQSRISQNVEHATLHWHPQGDFLAIIFARQTKGKKKIATIEILRMRQKLIPSDSLEIQDEIFNFDNQPLFSWEPRGSRFLLFHREPGTNARPNVSFYNMTSDKVVLTKTLEKRYASTAYWSPNGRFVVLVGYQQHNGHLDFFDSHDLEIMAERDHFAVSGVAWDPTGRYFATYVTATQQMENGYCIWSFCGASLNKVLLDRFFHFAWRPRPPTPLPASKLKQIKAKINEFSQKYTKLDKLQRKEARISFLQERRKIRDDFNALQGDLSAYWLAQGFRPVASNPLHWEEHAEVHETIIDTIEEVIEVIDD